MATDPDSAVTALSELIAELPAELRRQALTHSSWTERRIDSYERLAFLGDSVLGLAVASRVYEGSRGDRLRRPHEDPQPGGQRRLLRRGRPRASGCRRCWRANEPEDVTAAIPAKVLLEGERPLPGGDRGADRRLLPGLRLRAHRPCGGRRFRARIELAAETRIDFKSALQELLARRGARVSYEVIAATGPPHRRTFEVAAIVDSEQVGSGEGRSKKAAEQVAAEQALAQFGG